MFSLEKDLGLLTQSPALSIIFFLPLPCKSLHFEYQLIIKYATWTYFILQTTFHFDNFQFESFLEWYPASVYFWFVLRLWCAVSINVKVSTKNVSLHVLY